MSSRASSNVVEDESLSSLIIIAIVIGSTGLILMVLGGVYYLSRLGEGPPRVGAAEVDEKEDSEEQNEKKKVKAAAARGVTTEGEKLPARKAASRASPDDDEESQVTVKEELIEVYAPAGKLGVILDTVNAGPPVVHDIRSNSVLMGDLQLGDRLISVDDVDVRQMTANKVSKLISQKIDQPKRKLTIIRTVAPDVNQEAAA